MKVPEFTVDATNVYRTENYIVKQCIGIKYGHEENNVIFSHDTYYARNRHRDNAYERYYCERKNLDGKRLPTTMYARKYVK